MRILTNKTIKSSIWVKIGNLLPMHTEKIPILTPKP